VRFCVQRAAITGQPLGVIVDRIDQVLLRDSRLPSPRRVRDLANAPGEGKGGYRQARVTPAPTAALRVLLA
jgi:hypothetical protein